MIARHISSAAARALGLQALTTGYRPEETPMLENVMHDMRRSSRPWALVPDPQKNIEVWVRPIPEMEGEV
jgi:hypothetical protein